MTASKLARGVKPDSFLGLLDQAERNALDRLGVTRSFPRGSMLMFQHEPGERVMILLAGRVKTSRIDDAGHELLLSIRDPGDVLGELAFIDSRPRLATVTAIEQVKALVISSQAFRAHLEQTPRVAVALLHVITRRFRQTTLLRAQLASADTIGRLSARIVELAERYGEPSDHGVLIMLPLTRDELAAWTGASRAGVAHAFQTLRELGWIQTDRRRILVRDLESLRSRAA